MIHAPVFIWTCANARARAHARYYFCLCISAWKFSECHFILFYRCIRALHRFFFQYWNWLQLFIPVMDFYSVYMQQFRFDYSFASSSSMWLMTMKISITIKLKCTLLLQIKSEIWRQAVSLSQKQQERIFHVHKVSRDSVSLGYLISLSDLPLSMAHGLHIFDKHQVSISFPLFIKPSSFASHFYSILNIFVGKYLIIFLAQDTYWLNNSCHRVDSWFK